MATNAAPKVERQTTVRRTASQTTVRELASNEFIFGVVGPVGSGTSEIAEALQSLLKIRGYQAKILKARDIISAWAANQGHPIPAGPKLAETEALQNSGDQLREQTGDNAAVALRLISAIRVERARQLGLTVDKGKPIEPDGKNRAFILDSLRHPHEVALLRRVYQDAFCLIGIVCDEAERSRRLREEKYRDAGADALEKLMRRDENAPEKHGQKVADTFHLADFFVDNTVRRFAVKPGGKKEENAEWNVPDQLGRLIDVLNHSRIVRPRPNEVGMFHAYGARMRSSCLSRQVGAALLDEKGNVIATGTNEVPRAGGGVYGGRFEQGSASDPHPDHDFRCVVHNGYCSNNREQNAIIRSLLSEIDEFKTLGTSDDLIKRIRKTRIGQLIEFSRSVHAEMDALLSAARQGVSTAGTRLFVTTFPCHNCARHIVAAGVDEVHFIEPYLKSKALPLHGDAITTDEKNWLPPSAGHSGKHPRVLFRPFTGVAPRLFRRAFYKDRDLKDDYTGDMKAAFGPADGHATFDTLRVSYAQVEARLAESE